jgi:hypothetical protein
MPGSWLVWVASPFWMVSVETSRTTARLRETRISQATSKRGSIRARRPSSTPPKLDALMTDVPPPERVLLTNAANGCQRPAPLATLVNCLGCVVGKLTPLKYALSRTATIVARKMPEPRND